jgi:Fur family ferric uptake transcriptional regulator
MIAATHSNHPLAPVRTDAPAAALSPVDAACVRLRERGLRITKPRVALLEVLARQPGPASIERLHRDLAGHPCDLVTVYRCLGVFEGIGVVRRSFQHNGTSLYELTAGGGPRHYHILCKACGKPERVDYFPITGAEQLLRERGYTDLSHLVEFFGVCPACQAEASQRRIPSPPTR